MCPSCPPGDASPLRAAAGNADTCPLAARLMPKGRAGAPPPPTRGRAAASFLRSQPVKCGLAPTPAVNTSAGRWARARAQQEEVKLRQQTQWGRKWPAYPPLLRIFGRGPGLCVPMSSRPTPAEMPTSQLPAWVGTEALGRAIERMGEGSGSGQAHRAGKRGGGWRPGTRLLLAKPSEAGQPGSCSGALFRSWKQLLKFSFGDSGQSHFSF